MVAFAAGCDAFSVWWLQPACVTSNLLCEFQVDAFFIPDHNLPASSSCSKQARSGRQSPRSAAATVLTVWSVGLGQPTAQTGTKPTRALPEETAETWEPRTLHATDFNLNFTERVKMHGLTVQMKIEKRKTSPIFEHMLTWIRSQPVLISWRFFLNSSFVSSFPTPDLSVCPVQSQTGMCAGMVTCCVWKTSAALTFTVTLAQNLVNTWSAPKSSVLHPSKAPGHSFHPISPLCTSFLISTV